MPIRTPHFGLEAFVSGDAFSASVDQRRMRLIDSHLAFLADIIGDGIIEGWEMTESAALTLSVSAGMGMVNRFVTRTFGSYSRILLDNNKVYVWMRRRSGVVGQTSGFSNMVSFVHADTVAPAVPSALTLVSKTTSTISFSWTGGTEFDFSLFNIYRSQNNIDFEFIDTSTGTTFIDSDLFDGTQYYYRLSAVDRSGNQSSRSLPLSVITLVDTSPPSDPSSIEAVAGDTVIHLVWRASAVGTIDHYKIEYTAVSAEGVDEGSTLVQTVAASLRYTTLIDLTNGQRYRVVIKAVGANGEESHGITRTITPVLIHGPKDVSEIAISDEEGDGVISDIVLDIDWMQLIDPYDGENVVSHQIQIKEFDGDAGVITSEWITVPTEDSTQIKVYPFIDSGTIVYRSIQERTEYFITIRSVDDNGLLSPGKKAVYTTRCFRSPNPVTMMLVEQLSDQTLVASWVNSTSIFQSNKITVSRDDGASTTVIENNADIGRATRHSIVPGGIVTGNTYTFSVRAEDEFGNLSTPQSATFSIPDLGELEKPSVPSQQIGVAGDREITLSWNKADIDFVSGYRIYRATEQVVYRAGDFERLDTVPGDTFTYTDYGLDDDSNYVYFITTVDLYGVESRNPIDDGYFDYNLISLTPNRTGELDQPENLAIVTDGGNGVVLTWDISTGIFDGYEVYRSVGNRYSFEKLALVSPSLSAYHDINSLVQDGTYYYMVRKVRNEADLFITESNVTVAGAIQLGVVTTSNGSMSISTDGRRIIRNLEDPIKEEVDVRIRAHRHLWYSDNDDRRINLGETALVSDWTTTDEQQFFTDTDISNVTTFQVFVNDILAENLGLFYLLDKDEGRLTFEERLAPGSGTDSNPDDFPFPDTPVIKVYCDNLLEVQGELPRERLEGASAQQVSVGLIEERELPTINHDGRIRERLVPVQESTISIDDGFRFAPANDSVTQIGAATVWYDVIFAAGTNADILVAATSNGILTSDDFGLTWEKQFETPSPALKLFYSETNNFYFALTNRGVFGSGGGSDGGFSNWSEIQGMETSKIARDIIEDGSGAVFCSSDLGVYRLKKDLGRGSFFWQQTPIFGPRSTEAYALLYDPSRSRMIVSNELGIFETANQGDRWTFSAELPEQKPLYAMVYDLGYIYAISQYIVWRRKPTESEFEKVAILDVALSRKLLFWRDRLFISTDAGVLVSAPNANLHTDAEIKFVSAFSQVNRGAYVAVSTSLNVIDDKMFIGSENNLYVASTPGRVVIQTQTNEGVIPTVYVNGEEYRIGYRFSTATERLRKFISFDEKIPVGSVVTFANQYQKFTVQNGGWTDLDFASKVFVYKDGKRINSISLAEKPIQAMGTLRWPVYNDRNAHKAGADSAFVKVTTSLTALLASQQRGTSVVFTGFTTDNVRTTMYAIEKFMSQIYSSARVIEELGSDGKPVFRDSKGVVVPSTTAGAIKSFIAFVPPPFIVALISCDEVDASIGTFGRYGTLYANVTAPGLFGSELSG